VGGESVCLALLCFGVALFAGMLQRSRLLTSAIQPLTSCCWRGLAAVGKQAGQLLGFGIAYLFPSVLGTSPVSPSPPKQPWHLQPGWINARKLALSCRCGGLDHIPSLLADYPERMADVTCPFRGVAVGKTLATAAAQKNKGIKTPPAALPYTFPFGHRGAQHCDKGQAPSQL
jgi:hypothetical protein